MEGPLATIKFAKTICSVHACFALAAAVLMPAAAWSGLQQDSPLLSGNLRAQAVRGAFGFELPPALCSLVDGINADRPGGLSGQSAASFPDLLKESVPVGTGMGYDLGPVRIQGIGVYDPQENYASLGPAFRLDIARDFEITTGIQLPLTENGPGGTPGLYYAEFTILF